MSVKPYLSNRLEALADACGQFARGEFRLGTGALSGALFGPGSRFPTTNDWVYTWGALGELLLPLARAARGSDDLPARELAALRTEFLSFAAGDRVCREWLDEFVVSSQDSEEVGRRVLDSVLRAASRAIRDAQRDISVIETSLGRELTKEESAATKQLMSDFSTGVLAPVAEVAGTEIDHGPRKDLSADEAKRTWLGIGGRVPLETIPAIIYLSRKVGQEVFLRAPQTIVQPGEDFFEALNDPRTGLPPQLAAKFTAGDRLMSHKAFVEQEAGYFNSGIEAPGTTELDRRGFPYLFGEGSQRSIVVLAPTSAGKSRFGQLALIQSVMLQKRRHSTSSGRSLILAPTKALVDQVSRELKQLLADTEAASWVVLEGSRDYPQNDEAIRTGRFDIAVIIPEKLAALVRSGMNIARVPLILVDELQHIVDGRRGLQLESLLLDILGGESVPRVVGLSASLAPPTVALLQSWFTRNNLGVDFLEIEARPVPLTVSVVDDYRRLVSRTHIRDDRSIVEKRLPTIPQALGKPAFQRTAKEFRRTLALLMDLLEPSVQDAEFKDDTPSILVFVRSKKIAEDLAEICRELIVRYLGVGAASPDILDQPQSTYRFTQFSQIDSDVDPTTTLRLLAPTPLRQQLASTLSSGVGFHSASLTAVGREFVEDLFRRGVVRVLFATDTLRLGINLPTDIVINGDLVVYSGEEGPQLVDKDALLQRLGRAGRLLRSRGIGNGYFVTPQFIDDKAQYQVDTSVAKLFTGRPEARWEQIKQAATNQDALYKAFVADWTGGAFYAPPIDNDWFQDLLLQQIERYPGRAMTQASLDIEASELFERTLAGVSGERKPSGAEEALERIGAIKSVGGALRLTDAGHATAMNALGVGDLPVIQRVALEATAGAGPLSLLYLACQSDFVTRSHQDLRVKPQARTEVLESMLEQISKVRAASSSTERRNRDQFMRNFGDDVVDCLGRGQTADELAALLDVDEAAASTEEELTALWRAFNIYMRWAGLSYVSLANMPNPSGVKISEVGLDRLAANVAYFIAAASDLLGINPTTMHFRTLAYFAGEVELGVPTALSPLLHLNRPSIDRERVLGISGLLSREGLRWDGLAELFKIYMEESKGVPPRSQSGWHALPESEVDWVLDKLDDFDRKRSSAAYSVAADIESMILPGMGGQRVGDVLLQIPQGNARKIFTTMFESFGLTLAIGVDDRALVANLTKPAGGTQRTHIYFPSKTVDNALLDEVLQALDEGDTALVVATEGSTFGAITRGRFLEHACAIVDPSLMVEMVARVYSRNAKSSVDVLAEDLLDEIFGAPELPEVDFELAQEDLSRVLLYNAPMLSRTDLENRLAYIDLAEGARSDFVSD